MKRGRFRKKCFTILLLFNLFFVGVLFISSYHTTNRIKRIKENLSRRNKTQLNYFSFPQRKHVEENVILFWTKYFNEYPLSSSIALELNETDQECIRNCHFTSDRNYFGVSKAVLFHSRDMRKDDWPPTHPRNQIWVYLQQESPSYTTEDLTDYANVFNWTMTYRKDSDIHYSYGRVVPVDSQYRETNQFRLENDIMQKPKLVFWVVSNCYTKSKREYFVDQLEQHIPIDIYGRCGDFSCNRSPPDGCLPLIAPQYKFYLSFENSICSDYVTEKLFKALKYNLVPIVYGGADYNSILPPGSFININDFKSPKALADHLVFLDKNPDEYMEFFKWKLKYKVVNGNGWCELCKKVEAQNSSGKRKIYGNLWKWWYYTRENEGQRVSLDSSSNLSKEQTGDEAPFQFPESTYIPACQDEYLENSFNTFDLINALQFKKLRRWFRNSIFGSFT